MTIIFSDFRHLECPRTCDVTAESTDYNGASELAGFAIQQKPARGLSTKFNNKVLGVREAGGVGAGLRLILPQAASCCRPPVAKRPG